MKTYTVIGFWDGDDPLSAGVIEGNHPVDGGWDAHDGPWAASVDAKNADEAEVLAKKEILSEQFGEQFGDDEDEDEDEKGRAA